MKIGIIGAMESEVAQLKAVMENVEIKNLSRMEFYEGQLLGKDVVVVRSGVGKVNAACCTEVLAAVFKVDCIINTGIAGSLNAKIDIGDIVLCTDALQHDMEAVAFGYAPGVIPQMKCSTFVADEKMRALAKSLCRSECPDINVHEGRVVTGDQFIASREKKDFLVSEFSGMCCEMEGAAIAHAAYLNDLPFLIIRAISDKADDSAHVDYPTFEKKAIEHCVALTKALVKNL